MACMPILRQLLRNSLLASLLKLASLIPTKQRHRTTYFGAKSLVGVGYQILPPLRTSSGKKLRSVGHGHHFETWRLRGLKTPGIEKEVVSRGVSSLKRLLSETPSPRTAPWATFLLLGIASYTRRHSPAPFRKELHKIPFHSRPFLRPIGFVFYIPGFRVASKAQGATPASGPWLLAQFGNITVIHNAISFRVMRTLRVTWCFKQLCIRAHQRHDSNPAI